MISYLISLTVFLLFFTTAIVLIKYFNIRSYLILLGCLSVLYFSLTVLSVFLIKINVFFWSFFSCYWFLIIAFFFVFFGLRKSISVSILSDLLQSPENSLDYEWLLYNYLTNKSFVKRIDILLKNEMIDCVNGKYLITEKGKKYIGIYSKVQKFFLVKQSG